MTDQAAAAFTQFVEETGPRLKQSLMALLGGEAGRDATAEALGWAWEHWDRLQALANPGGYLYRLGRNRSVSQSGRRRAITLERPATQHDPWVEPALEGALDRLSETQRVVVVLIHGFGWTFREVADHLGVATGTVQTHADRGMAKLRAELKVESNA
jgi:RNA polymerase sigma factor (sigma-70 family)